MNSQSPARDPWILRKKVLPQHTDHAGVMWHGSYINWLEEARIDALLNTGYSYDKLSNEGYELPVFEMSIKFISPLYHGDEVILESWVIPTKGARWVWRTNFLKKDNVPTSIANVSLVLIRRDKSRHNLVRNPPGYISSLLKNLQLGPSI